MTRTWRRRPSVRYTDLAGTCVERPRVFAAVAPECAKPSGNGYQMGTRKARRGLSESGLDPPVLAFGRWPATHLDEPLLGVGDQDREVGGGCSPILDETLRLWYTTHWLEVSYDCGVFFHPEATFEKTLPSSSQSWLKPARSG